MIGESFGNFVVVSRLGRGGMGEVFLAKHKELETPVAVKVLNEDISSDKDHVQRLFNEARIVSRIKHAGTIKIFDSGFLNGHAYLVMELLDGESLSTRLQRGPVPVPQLLDICRQIASVLDATHRSGVIHRDLKPDNIFLVGDDERASGERVKVLDFGIAKLSGSSLAGHSPKTMGTMGTPAYMAPEQWGDSAQVDWRADAYSLGCVIFEMACGRPPFIAETIPEAYTKHVHTKPASPRSFEPSIPAELDELILRLLAKDPADRCVSMGQVVRELQALAGEAPDGGPALRPSRPMTPVPARTLTTLGASAAEIELPKPRKNLAMGGIASAVVGLVVVFAIVMTRSSRTAPAADKSAVAPAGDSAVAATPTRLAAQPPVTPTPVDAGAPAVTVDASAPAITSPPASAAHEPSAVAHVVHGKPPKARPPTPAASAKPNPTTQPAAPAQPAQGPAKPPSDEEIMGGRL